VEGVALWDLSDLSTPKELSTKLVWKDTEVAYLGTDVVPNHGTLSLGFAGETLVSTQFFSPSCVTVRVWDTKSGRTLFEQSMRAGTKLASCVTALSPDGKLLAIAKNDGEENTVQELATAKVVSSFGASGAWSLAFSRDRKTLAVGGQTGIQLWDVTSGKLLPPRAN
jgi:WD40 repeat protein